jgi:alkylated DNA nucleotide flippase Atl1
MTGPKLPWWRVLRRAAVRDTQGSWYRTWRDHAALGGEQSEWAVKSRARYYEHVAEHGRYDLPRWRTR